MRKRGWLVVASVVGVVGLAACGSDGSTGGEDRTSSSTKAPTSSTSAPAAPAAAPTLELADTTLGEVVADADGKVLYLYQPDGDAEQTTVPEALLAAWPPVVVSTAPTVGTGLDQSLVSTGTQTNGEKWVRYNGHLLYGFTSDTSPGDVTGNGVGGVWFAVTAAGDAVAS